MRLFAAAVLAFCLHAPALAQASEEAEMMAEALSAYRAFDYVNARTMAEQAAAAGSTRGATLFASMLERGLGGPRDEEEAVIWYRRSGQAGDAEALFALGVMARDGRGGLVRESAPDLLRSAADLGVADARYELALLFMDDEFGMEDVARGRAIMEVAAGEGVTEAQRDFGLLLLEEAESEEDVAAALVWLNAAAAQSDAQAAYAAGYLYFEGARVAEDEARARELFAVAAEGGHAAAAADLGWLNYLSAETAGDFAAATALLLQAAEGGDPQGGFRYAWARAEHADTVDDLQAAYAALLAVERAQSANALAYAEDRAALRAWLEDALRAQRPEALENASGSEAPAPPTDGEAENGGDDSDDEESDD